MRHRSLYTCITRQALHLQPLQQKDQVSRLSGVIGPCLNRTGPAENNAGSLMIMNAFGLRSCTSSLHANGVAVIVCDKRGPL